MYFVGSESNDNVQIWTQGQGKYTSHWFPSFDDVNESGFQFKCSI
jgi:aminopeptidase N